MVPLDARLIVLNAIGNSEVRFAKPKGKSMWQKNGSGPKFKGHYIRDAKGERVMVLIGFTKKNEMRTVTAESWEMLKAVGWKKIS